MELVFRRLVPLKISYPRMGEKKDERVGGVIHLHGEENWLEKFSAWFIHDELLWCCLRDRDLYSLQGFCCFCVTVI